MKIKRLSLIEGAKQAEGLTVIIDVFRAFTVEGFLFEKGVKRIYPIGSIEDAFQLHEEMPEAILFGERGGARVEGCDYGNSPSSFISADFAGRMVIHTTSAGTQGIVNASHAQEIVAAALTNAAATARYIQRKNPGIVSIVAMGTAGIKKSEEDELCGLYIESLLTGNPLPGGKSIQQLSLAMRDTVGRRFFDPARQSVFPKEDWPMCVDCDRFPFVIHVEKDETGRLMTRRLDVPMR